MPSDRLDVIDPSLLTPARFMIRQVIAAAATNGQ
jgi:hypothetical protein